MLLMAIDQRWARVPARSTTRGDSGMRPLNHGLTVWRSEEATSIGCGAISARMWSETSDSAVVLSGGGR